MSTCQHCKGKHDINDCPHLIEEVTESAFNAQVGGAHYKDMAIQPVEFIMANKLPYCEANAIKYICRHKAKNGRQDLEKAIHYLKMLIEREYP
jgi:hypothetical protein